MSLTGKIWNYLYRGISVRKKIVTSFFWIFFILAIIFIWVVIFQSNRKANALSVDIAGRTRMLTEKILLFGHVSLNDDEFVSKKAKEELQKTMDQLDAYYEILKNGGNDLLPENANIYIAKTNKESITSLLKEIDPVLLKYKSFLNVLIKEPKYIEQKNTDQLNDSTLASTSQEGLYANAGIGKVLNPEVKNAIEDLEHYSSDNELLANNQKLVNLYIKNLEDYDHLFLVYFTIFFIIGLIIILFNSILIFVYLVKPIDQISKAAEHIAMGDVTTKINYDIDDELGKVVGSINTLTGNLRKTTEFITRIGKGDFAAEYDVKSVEGLDDKDNLGFALVNMRNQLKTVSDEDKKRNWVTEGLAKFGELLRKGSGDIEELAYEVIYNLVKYLDANQGSIFIVSETDKKEEVLELKACYAWDRKKFRNMQIRIGEGLVGQAWQENETIYLSDFPKNYIEITSGLGKANPNNLLIVPLKLNDQTYGIIEVASFKEFQKYHREFIEKIGESVASTISSVKINSQTKKLLEETQLQSEQMKEQEEEMRQNMEEMQATQEEMARKEQETKKILMELKNSEEQARAQEEELRQNMEEMQASMEETSRLQAELEAQMNIVNKAAIVSKTDLRGNITYVNDEFLKWAKYSREELMGKPHNIIRHPDMPAAAFEDLWKTISKGKVWRGQVKNKAKDGSAYWVDATIAPIIGQNGKPKEYMAVRYVITEAKEQEEQLKEKIRLFEEQIALNMRTEQELEKVKREFEEIKKNKKVVHG